MTVVLVASSQTAHPDSSSPSGTAIAAGAPGIPTNGPRLALWIAEALTASGFEGVPAMSRADARFSTGFAHHDDLRAAKSAWGAKERQDGACGNDDHREDDTGYQRKRLRAKRII